MEKRFKILPLMILCFLLVGSSPLKGQDLRSDFRAANRYLAELEYYKASTEQSVYPANDLSDPIISTTSVIYRKGSSFYMKKGRVEVINNDSRLVVADHDNQYLMVGRKREIAPEGLQKRTDKMMEEIDSMMRDYKEVEYLGKDDQGHNSYRIELPASSPYQKMRMVFYSDPVHLKELYLFPRGPQRVRGVEREVVYHNHWKPIIREPDMPEKNLDIRKFIEWSDKNGGYQPVTAYQDYQIIDHFRK